MCCAAQSVAPSTALAGSDIGWYGLRHGMNVNLYRGTGRRRSKEGAQYMLAFKAAGFGKTSTLGNLAGLEFDAGIGWDNIGYDENDTVLGDMGVPMYMAIGFPVTMFRKYAGDGEGDRIQIGFSPGFGISWENAWCYLRLKGAARLTSQLAVDVTWTWMPDAVSVAMGDRNDAQNGATVRANAYLAMGGRRGGSVNVYVELAKAQLVNQNSSGGNKSKVLFAGEDPFGSTTREGYEDILRIGVGYAF